MQKAVLKDITRKSVEKYFGCLEENQLAYLLKHLQMLY